MTTFQANWDSFTQPRQSDLSKMIVVSVVLHVFLFLFVVLNQFFFDLDTPKIHGFQVNLISPAFGPPAGGGDGSAATASRPTKATKKAVSVPPKKSQNKVPTTPVKAKPVVSPTKAAVKPSAPPIVAKAPTVAKTAASAALTRPPRVSVKHDPVEEDDPDRLDAWWKNQKKSLKIPKSNQKKILPSQIRRTRTAKIDIAQPPVLSKTVSSPKPLSPKAAVPVAVAAPILSAKKELSLGQEPTGSVNDSVSPPVDSVPEQVASVSQSVSGPLGLGVVGGGSSFRFPGYLQKVDHKIRWQWAPPPSTGERGRLVIRFVIEKNGRINKRSIAFEERSGSEFFDQAGMRALYAADPLPPLPEDYKEQQLLVYINFSVTEVY